MIRWLLIIFFILGCSTKEIPKWYINTPKDNNIYIYASGEGSTKQEAINNALNFMASKIKVKVFSNMNATSSIIQNKDNADVYKNISQNVNAKVENITFYNYEVEKLKKVDDKYYVLVKVNKKETAQKIVEKIKNKINLPKTNSDIEKIKILNQKIKELKKLKNDYEVAKLLDPNIEKINIDEYIQKYSNELKKITLNVYSNSKTLRQSLLTYLNKYSISKKPKIKINVYTSSKTKKIVGEYSTKTNVILKIKDKTTQKVYKTSCMSLSYDKKTSQKIGLKKCENKIKRFLDETFGN